MTGVDTARRVRPLRAADPGHLGDYRLLGRLGSGGMGVVFLAEDPHGRLVAAKLVHAGPGQDDEFLARFRSEINRARQVPSFCTAEVLDADLSHSPPYLVVEYVDGPSLAEVVEQRGPLTGAPLHAVAAGVATALTGIHGAGVIHRDLKPENVLLAPGGPKVIDFGIARAFEATSRHTRTDQFVGTVSYMSPERFDNESGAPLTPAADVFAWGCVIGFAGTGRSPFRGDTPTVTAGRILTQPPNLDGLDPHLRGIVERALAKDPAARPTAPELLTMLTAAPAAPVIERRPRRRRLVPALALLGVLVLLAGLATVALLTQEVGRDPVAEAAPVVAPSGVGAAQPVPPASGAPSDLPSSPAVGGSAAAPGPVTRKPSREPAAEPGRADDRAATPGAVLVSRPAQFIGPADAGADAICVLEDDVLRLRTGTPGIHHCDAGTKAVGTFAITLDASSDDGDACVGVWIHYTQATGGDFARVCPDLVTAFAMRLLSDAVYGTVRLPAPPPGVRAETELRVSGTTITVLRNGRTAGKLTLAPDSPATGPVLIGLSTQAGRTAPFTARVYDVEVRAPL